MAQEKYWESSPLNFGAEIKARDGSTKVLGYWDTFFFLFFNSGNYSGGFWKTQHRLSFSITRRGGDTNKVRGSKKTGWGAKTTGWGGPKKQDRGGGQKKQGVKKQGWLVKKTKAPAMENGC